MAELAELREQLDQIDDKIAELYEKRMEICAQVGEYKIKAGKKVFDRQREKEKLADVASKVKGEFNRKGIQELYQQLMSMSRKLQYRQLASAGHWEDCPLFRWTVWIKRMQELCFRGRKAPTARLLCSSFSGRMSTAFT